MNPKPLLYDLFCKAGGCTRGYQQAGFYVVGVDIDPQPHYVGDGFIQMDALEFLRRLLAGEYSRPVMVSASPPCQFASGVTPAKYRDNHRNLIPATRELLKQTGLPYIIENVSGARGWLKNPLMLCGSMFPGLRVERHRFFECNPEILFSPATCNHQLCYTVDKRKKHYGRLDEMKNPVQVNGGGNCSVAAASDAMRIDWMTKAELNQAIPPAYTAWIGRQMLTTIKWRD